MKITKSQLKQIIEETLREFAGGGGFGGLAGNLGAVAGRRQDPSVVDAPDSILHKQGIPDSTIRVEAFKFFLELGITDEDACKKLADIIAAPDLKEIMRLIPKLDTAQEEEPQ